MMDLIDKMDKEDVICVDRTGNIITLYCKNDIKIVKMCRSKSQASKLLTKYRRKFENIRLGVGV